MIETKESAKKYIKRNSLVELGKLCRAESNKKKMSARPATDSNKESDIPEKLFDANSGTTYDRKRFFGKVSKFRMKTRKKYKISRDFDTNYTHKNIRKRRL